VSRVCLILLLPLLLSACSDASFSLGEQSWEEVQFVVETRPSPPVQGMNEFLVIATGQNRRKAHDLIISLRTDPKAPWKQAIQDGHVGVYRKALPISDVMTDVLYVHIRQRSGAEGELAFPLKPGSEHVLR